MNKNEFDRIEDFLQDESFVRWVNQSNAEDAAVWEKWALDNPTKKALADNAVTIVKGIQFMPKTIKDQQVETALKKLNQTIDRRLTETIPAKQNTFSRRKLIGIAASISFLVLSYIAIAQYNQPREVIYQTAYGEQIDLKLADGTEVALNANSTLRFFPKKAREVWLEGEAFFTVEKKPSTGAKFWVHTADLDIEVLGTAFNVNSLMAKTQVMLEEGKINLKLKDGSIKMMEPGELVSFSAKTNKVIKKEKKVNAELHTSWKDGVLIFKEISLEEAMQKIETTYGVEVVFGTKALAQKPISFAVPTKNLEICINAFRKALQIKIEQKGKLLTITK